MNAIFHIVDRDAWAAAVASGEYRPASLESEGFVHFSFAHQVRATADNVYAGVPDLFVVEIDPSRVPHELRVEDSYRSGTAFPHVYGPIPVSATVRTHDLSEFSATGLEPTDR